MQRPHFNSYPASQFPNQIQPIINNNNTTAPLNPQVFPTGSSLANLCKMLPNSMPMQQPQMGIIMNPQIHFPFHNHSNPFMPNFSPFITQQQQQQQPPAFINRIGMAQTGFAPQNHLNNMFLNQLNPSQLQAQSFPINFSNIPQQLNQNMGFPNLQNPIQNLSFQMQSPVGPQNSNFAAVGQQANPNQQVQGSSSSIPHAQSFYSFKKQGNPANDGQQGTSRSKWKKFPNKDLKKNPNLESSKLGYKRSQSHHMNNGKRKFGERNGQGNERITKSGVAFPNEQARETKRSLALIYSDQEIKQWREERRKNFPSRANMEKKCSERQTNSEGVAKDAKLRREQLKEILAKQAELGVEVAEIPAEYLLDSEKHVEGMEDGRKSTLKKGRFRNKHDRRGKHNRQYSFAKQNTLTNKGSSNVSSFSERKPTLLQKLLSADVRKDEHRLLQVFRFMMINSFFEDCPEKPLKFPCVAIKGDQVVVEKSPISREGTSDVSSKKVENFTRW